MLEPLPYRDPERIVAVWENRLDRNRPRNVIASANFVAWRERSTSFEYLGMVGPSRQNIVLNGQPTEVAGFFASADALAAWPRRVGAGQLDRHQERVGIPGVAGRLRCEIGHVAGAEFRGQRLPTMRASLIGAPACRIGGFA